ARSLHRLLGISARLGVENVARELGRSAITACALVLSTSMTVTIACFSYSYETSCLAWIEHAIQSDMIVSAGPPVLGRYAVPFSPNMAKKLDGTPGIRAVDPSRSMWVPIDDHRVEVLALDTALYLADPAAQTVLAGPNPVPPDALARAPAVLVSESF